MQELKILAEGATFSDGFKRFFGLLKYTEVR
jgi:hypothetical protein